MNSTCQTKEGEGEVAASRQEYILKILPGRHEEVGGALRTESAGIHRAQVPPRSDLILHHGGHLRELQTILA